MTDQRPDREFDPQRGGPSGAGPADGAGDPTSRIQPGPARFGVVLLLILTTFILMTAAPSGRWAVPVTTALQATTLLAALHAAGARRLVIRVAVVVSLVSLTGALAEMAAGDPGQRDAYFLVDMMLVGAAPVAIAAGVLRRRRLDVHTVMGALCVYVLLGMFWSFVYAAVGALASEPFFAQTAHPNSSDYTYFSYVTLTTTGYGDLTAASGLGRAMAVLEALVGQLYLVTVVALLVGNLSPRQRD